MASVSGKDSKYPDGHKVQLVEKPSCSASVQAIFKKSGYAWGSSVFSLYRNVKKTDKITQSIQVTSTGSEVLVLKDTKNKLIRLSGSKTGLDGLFVHAGDGKSSKSDTNAKTEVKELVSMWLFESVIERNKMMKEDEIITKLGTKKKNYETIYYTSAQKQVAALKPKLGSASGYTYERQRDNLTAPLYDLARKLSGKANDNWNPGDVWMIKKNFDMKKLLTCTTIDDLNDKIAAEVKKKTILPISLKQIEGPKAKYSIIDPSSQKQVDMDFAFDKVDLSESFNNFILWTKSGFGIRVGYKAAGDNFSIFLEGRMSGATSQIGAVDKKAFVPHIKDTYSYVLRNGQNAPPESDYPMAKKELKAVFDKYIRVSNKLKTYKDAEALFNSGNALIKGRFANISSFMYGMLIAPNTPKKFEELMRYCYYSAKKLTNGACVYVLINE